MIVSLIHFIHIIGIQNPIYVNLAQNKLIILTLQQQLVIK